MRAEEPGTDRPASSCVGLEDFEVLIEEVQLLSPSGDVPLSLYSGQTLLYFFGQFSLIARQVTVPPAPKSASWR